MLAALLGWGAGRPSPRKSAIDGDKAKVTAKSTAACRRSKVKMPAIVTTDLRLNEPRYASLPNIMKAKKKPLDEKTPGRLRRRCRAAPEGGQDGGAGRPQGRRQGGFGRRTRRETQERSRGDLMAVLLLLNTTTHQ
jgi:electron transfer flavoprotein alpha/beta subunit